MNILFVTYRESPTVGASVGVMQTQVTDLLQRIAFSHRVCWLALGEDFPEERSESDLGNILLISRNIGSAGAGPERWRARQALKDEIKRFLPDLLHVRGYNAALIAASLVHTIPRIFDPRTRLPLERAAFGSGAGIALRNIVWRRIERSLVRRFDATIAVSETMQSDLVVMAPNRRVVWIPLAADHRRFDAVAEFRYEKRKELGFETSDVVVLYSGTLRYSSPDDVARLLRRIADGTPKVRFFFLTPDDTESLTASVKSLGLALEIVTATPNEMPSLLVAGDWGLQLAGIDPDPTPAVLALCRTILGTKVPEYLAAGLGVVVSPRYTWLAALLEEHHVGIAPCIDEAAIALTQRNDTERVASRALQRELFDLDATQAQLEGLYKNLAVKS